MMGFSESSSETSKLSSKSAGPERMDSSSLFIPDLEEFVLLPNSFVFKYASFKPAQGHLASAQWGPW